VPPSGVNDSVKQTNRHLWMLEDLENLLPLVLQDAERFYGLALIQMMRGRFDDGVQSLVKAVKANPLYAPASYLLGDTYLRLGKCEEAITELERAVKRNPGDLNALVWLSLAYRRLGSKGKLLLQRSILQTIAPDLVEEILSDPDSNEL
jgi:tetratricopeptide (TPR) repeat protein